jgi:putative ABC transport system permease protein
MAKRYWPGQNPLGQQVELPVFKMTLEIVGVVRDVKPFRPDATLQAEIYWPFAQVPRWAIQVVVRTSADPSSLIPTLRARLENFDPDMDIGRIRTMEQHIDRQLVNPRFNMTIVVIFAIVALVTAAVGIYGVLSYAVTRRTQEIGVRLALGAIRRDIFRLIFRQALSLTLAGLAIGLAGALFATRFLSSLLVGVQPHDPVTFLAMGAFFLAVALLACYVPARRATAVDPLVVLRYE